MLAEARIKAQKERDKLTNIIINEVNSTFKECFLKYCEHKKNVLRPSIKSLETCYKNYFSKLDNKKLYKITRKNILKALEPLIQSNKATMFETALDYFGDLEVKASKIKFEVEKIPQFVKLLPSGSILFEEINSKVLEKEDLQKDFKLADKDIQINFDLAEGSIFEVYLSKDDNLPKYKKVSQMQREYFKQYLKTKNDETRIRQSINLIFGKLRNDNALSENDLKSYIERIVNNLSDERKAKLLDEIDAYTIKIKNKIKELKSEYREKVFYDLLNKGNIKIENTFSFQPIIQASKLSSLRDKSLYEEEIDNLNSLEERVPTEIVSLDNIKWWHRNKDMKPGFCINAFINHYPDFIICTENENIIMVEVKGDDITNDDSKTKLKLGSKWADKAGDKYFYFMVFENSKIEGSLLIDEFIDTIKEL